MNNLGLLLKTYMRTSFGFNKARYTHEKRSKSAGMTALLTVCYVLIIFAVFGMSMGMMDSLKSLHAEYIVLNIMMMAASVMVLFTTIYKVNGTLFGFRDYDLQMTLPIKTSTLIASRILILYLLNILFVLGVMVPAGVAYAIVAQPAPAFYPVFIITLFAIPMLPLIIATVIGTLIAMAASRFKRKNGMSVILTVAAFMAFMIVWLGFWTNSGDIIVNFADVGGMVNNVLTGIYPMTGLYGNAVGSFDILSLVLFLAISFGAFAAFTAVVAKLFKKLNTSITTTRTASNYKMTDLKEATPKKALYRREMKRYFSSSQYVLNTAVGPLMLIVVAVILLVSGVDGFGVYSEIPQFGQLLAAAAPMGISFFIAIGCTTAASVSLEGKNLWIIRSLPVDTRLILKAKLNVAMTLYIPTVIIGGTLFNIALSPDPLFIVLMYAIPLAYGYFTALFGLKSNLNNPNFDWTNEVTVIKQSKPTLVTMLVGMLLTIAPAVLALFFGRPVMVAALVLVALLDVLLYRSLMTKGAAQFESF
ncbi:ABC transporter permease [Christensenella tenuis]|jgi:ABC-2 type transport system permease protein|uniref:ABC transporter permease n=1 Tax=Christensenella tenuis TaxID=2763033 RepID=A0ABR7EGX5_9FIRM|nr:hypothetical protein [Christensenella tenuis]MBC5649007.1 hypothetical protein [Christensenella tenuis]